MDDSDGDQDRDSDWEPPPGDLAQEVWVVKRPVGRPIRHKDEPAVERRARRREQVSRHKAGNPRRVGRPRKENPTRPKQVEKQRAAYAENKLVGVAKLLQRTDSRAFQGVMICSSKTKAGAKEFDQIEQLVVRAEDGAQSKRTLEYQAKRVGRGNKEMFVHLCLDSGMSEELLFKIAGGRLSTKYINAQFNNPPPAEEKTLFETQLYPNKVTRKKTHSVDEMIALEFFDDRTSVPSGADAQHYCRQLRLEKWELEAQRYATYPYYLRKHLAEDPSILKSQNTPPTRLQLCLQAVAKDNPHGSSDSGSDGSTSKDHFNEDEYDTRLQVITPCYLSACLYYTNIYVPVY